MLELLPAMDFLLLVITSRYSDFEEDRTSDPRFDLFCNLYFFCPVTMELRIDIITMSILQPFRESR
jgi:hypothetical protein